MGISSTVSRGGTAEPTHGGGPRCCSATCWKISSNSSFNLRSILEKEKLNGINFVDWIRNLRIVHRQEKKEYVLDTPYPNEPQNVAYNSNAYHAYVKHTDDVVDVQYLMLACMNSELQKQYESTNPHDMIVGLRGMFKNQARVYRFNTSKAPFRSKLAEGAPVSPHVIKIIGYIESLQRLGFPLYDHLATDVILQSLPASFEPLIMNYHMNGLKKTLTELHGMLKMAEVSLRKAPGHAEGVKGHWSRNCKKYLEEKKKNGGVASAQGINVFEINLAMRSNDAWGLKIIRRFTRDDVDLRIREWSKG
ncbi:uncharacterized protein [Miscanthus floridulus]|uniref:uncharacterized protein n=1 Tax=Miscanthus floridulus TaxID=154761 RepID=UPI003459DD2A